MMALASSRPLPASCRSPKPAAAGAIAAGHREGTGRQVPGGTDHELHPRALVGGVVPLWPPSPARTVGGTKPRREMQPFLSGVTPAIAEPYQLASLAGHLAFADAGTLDGNAAAAALAQKAADFILPQSPDAAVRFPRKWTDDMFMATAVLARVGAATKDPKYGAAAGRLLTSYAESLQRPDGLFIHALEGPHAWGRGNGFALLGVTEALTYLPDTWPDRARVLRHLPQARARARHPPVRRWQLAAGRGRADQLSRADGDRDDGGRHGARRAARLPGSFGVPGGHRSWMAGGRRSCQRGRHRRATCVRAPARGLRRTTT